MGFVTGSLLTKLNPKARSSVSVDLNQGPSSQSWDVIPLFYSVRQKISIVNTKNCVATKKIFVFKAYIWFSVISRMEEYYTTRAKIASVPLVSVRFSVLCPVSALIKSFFLDPSATPFSKTIRLSLLLHTKYFWI